MRYSNNLKPFKSLRNSYHDYLKVNKRKGFQYANKSFLKHLFFNKDYNQTIKRSFANHQSDQNGFDRMKKRLFGTEGTTWYPIPIGLGIAWLAFLHLKHVQDREKNRLKDDDKTSHDPDYLVEGPMHIHFYTTLPLRGLSRLWGQMNNYIVPDWLREPLFGVYAFTFGCNLDEAQDANLKNYPNLATFFYRSLKEGARTIDPNAILTCPSDGTVLHFGVVDENQRVEQIKGVKYSLPALLGKEEKKKQLEAIIKSSHSEMAVQEGKFAEINTVNYSLDEIMGKSNGNNKNVQKKGKDITTSSVLFRTDDEKRTKHAYTHQASNALYFCVIYLAPGDYHRFHSPTDWRVEKRRHFAGELFSVSPWMVNKLKNLFVLNERVVLLGKWKHGFFSMIPVGATNVGSIKINFDPELKTNTLEKLEKEPLGSFTELKYYDPSNKKSHGIEVKKGEEMGGFKLGSTVVLVFEAPKDKFEFKIEPGQTVRMGQALGVVGD